MTGVQCVCVINKTTAVTIALCVCVCVRSGLYLNLQPRQHSGLLSFPTHTGHAYNTTEQYPKITRKPPTPWAHIVLSVWRLPLLNNKLYFAAFKSNFLTFFNLNGNAWNGKHAHHHKYPQAQAHTDPGTGTFISLWLHWTKSFQREMYEKKHDIYFNYL